MGWYRRGKLALDCFRNLASRVVPQNPIFQYSSRICQSGYTDSGSKGARFNGLSLCCSISQRLGAQGVVGVNGNFHNLFLLGANRFTMLILVICTISSQEGQGIGFRILDTFLLLRWLVQEF